MLSEHQNDFAYYQFKKGILYITYKLDVELDLPASIKVVEDRLAMHEGISLPVLCDIRNLKSLNKAARTYLAIEGSTLVSKVAVVANSPVSLHLAQFFVNSSRPPVNIDTFKTIAEAEKFLLKNIK